LRHTSGSHPGRSNVSAAHRQLLKKTTGKAAAFPVVHVACLY
jgi:hypothetical protein